MVLHIAQPVFFDKYNVYYFWLVKFWLLVSSLTYGKWLCNLVETVTQTHRQASFLRCRSGVGLAPQLQCATSKAMAFCSLTYSSHTVCISSAAAMSTPSTSATSSWQRNSLPFFLQMRVRYRGLR